VRKVMLSIERKIGPSVSPLSSSPATEGIGKIFLSLSSLSAALVKKAKFEGNVHSERMDNSVNLLLEERTMVNNHHQNLLAPSDREREENRGAEIDGVRRRDSSRVQERAAVNGKSPRGRSEERAFAKVSLCSVK
jgi:hypothetical protein